MIAGSIIFSAGCALTNITISKVGLRRLFVIFIYDNYVIFIYLQVSNYQDQYNCHYHHLVGLLLLLPTTLISNIAIFLRSCGWWRRLMVLCRLLARTLH